MEIATAESRALMRPPKILVPLIKEDLKRAQDAGIPFYRAAGEKMIEAKAQLKSGEFTPWLKRHFDLGNRQARMYMAYARSDTDYRTLDDFREQHLGHDMRSRKSPRSSDAIRSISEQARTEQLRIAAQDAINAQQEREAQRKLAHRLIDIGYKVLAKELHPDRMQGDREAMARLNRVRTLLKGSV